MANTNRHFPLFRNLVFWLTLLSSIACLGLSAHIVHVHRSDWDIGSPDWASLALATSAISTLFLLAHYLLTLRRPGIGNAGFIGRIPTELATIFVLWVLWLASGALIRDRNRTLWSYSGKIWRETRALEALSFTNFGLLYTYWVSLLTLAGNANSRGGTNVWRSQANDFEWNHGNYRADHEKTGLTGRHSAGTV